MLESIGNIFKIPELKKRLLFSFGALGVYRLGVHVPTAGINSEALKSYFEGQQGTIFNFVDMFSGGAFSQFTVFSLGIMPYISASIILQLLTVVWPTLERLAKEGEHGRKKITQYTRRGTIALAAIQALGISLGLEAMQAPGGQAIVLSPGWGFRLMTTVTLMTGTAFLMWLGEQISERGIGNGISLLIFAGIVASLPQALVMTYDQLSHGVMAPLTAALIAVVAVVVTAGTVLMQQAQRRIPVQYAKRVVGRRMMGGQSTHIPLRINTAGVIPVIFASSIIMLPVTAVSFLSETQFVWLQTFVNDNLRPGALLYSSVYVAAIVFFCYFYTAIIFNPMDLADNMKKYGGFIPGIRAGKRTAEYIDKVLTRITLAGAIFLAAIAVLPEILIVYVNVPFYFGGTALLIVVGVGLDTVQQIESHLVMRHYETLLKRRRIGSRR
ncbi:MAG: preprotein translocase subunit SecY [Candidatus Schekmanbacteria bacterium]|nr:preprotein translocase subunit SecY [Candidatus Schekmanbacteria bacterium]